jgi:hypothetical protein
MSRDTVDLLLSAPLFKIDRRNNVLSVPADQAVQGWSPIETFNSPGSTRS